MATTLTNGSEFSTWGNKRSTDWTPVRVRFDDMKHETHLGAIIAGIERKSGLAVANCRKDMSYQERGEIVSTNYELTLGKPMKTGGYSVSGSMWLSLKR